MFDANGPNRWNHRFSSELHYHESFSATFDYTFRNASHKTANASETTGPNRIDHFAASELENNPEFGGGTGGGGLGGGASFVSDTGAVIAVTVKSACALSVFFISFNFVASSVTSFSSSVEISAKVVILTVNSTLTLSVAA